MKPHIKAAAASAAKWAFGLSAGFVLGPIVFSLAGGVEISGEVVAMKLITGIAMLPILFIGIWVWGTFSKKDPMTGTAIQLAEPTTEVSVNVRESASLENMAPKKPSKWNYVGSGVGIFMFLFLFLPEIINGTLANQYYLGAAFWVGVIIYCSLNIFQARQ